MMELAKMYTEKKLLLDFIVKIEDLKLPKSKTFATISSEFQDLKLPFRKIFFSTKFPNEALSETVPMAEEIY